MDFIYQIIFGLAFFYHRISHKIHCFSKYRLYQNHPGAPHSRSTLSVYLGLNLGIGILTRFPSDSYVDTEQKSENYSSSLTECSFIAFAVMPFFCQKPTFSKTQLKASFTNFFKAELVCSYGPAFIIVIVSVPNMLVKI